MTLPPTDLALRPIERSIEANDPEQEAFASKLDEIKKTVSKAFKMLPTPIRMTPHDTNQAKEGHFLKYSFPSVNIVDHVRIINSVFSSYARCQVGVDLYDPSLGCYIDCTLIKFLEQSEDDAQDIAWSTGRKVHALHTEIPRDHKIAKFRKDDLVEYKKRTLKRRKWQLITLKAVKDAWEKTGLFEKVLIPDTKFRIEELGECPGYVACTDSIFLVLKQLNSDLTIKKADELASPLLPLIWTRPSEESREYSCYLRERTKLESLPLTQKAWRAIRNSIPGMSPQEAAPIAEPPPIQEAEPPAEQPNDRPREGAVGSFFFRVGQIVFAIFALISKLFRFLRPSR